MTSEKTAVNKILIEASKRGLRLFINRVAKAWVGTVIGRTEGTLTLSAYRPIEAGLGIGSSDLIGWTPVKITQGMLCMTIAVFTAVEVKSENGRVSPEQRQFVAIVEKSGGIGVVAHDISEVDAAISSIKTKSK